MKRSSVNALMAAGFGLLLARSAWAHPGHGINGLVGGIVHPLTGIDHLCAMLAVGLWAAQLGKRALWLVPMTFVGIMAVGGFLGFEKFPLPYVESGIAASVLVLGLLIVSGLRMPTAAGMALVALFALFHGYAHGSEIQEGMSWGAFAAGFVLSTALLHATGLVLGLTLMKLKKPSLVRWAGGAVAMCGLLLFVGVL